MKTPVLLLWTSGVAAVLLALIFFASSPQDCREFVRSYELSRSVYLPASEASVARYKECRR